MGFGPKFASLDPEVDNMRQHMSAPQQMISWTVAGDPKRRRFHLEVFLNFDILAFRYTSSVTVGRDWLVSIDLGALHII